jgi:hypothetical protein
LEIVFASHYLAALYEYVHEGGHYNLDVALWGLGGLVGTFLLIKVKLPFFRRK